VMLEDVEGIPTTQIVTTETTNPSTNKDSRRHNERLCKTMGKDHRRAKQRGAELKASRMATSTRRKLEDQTKRKPHEPKTARGIGE
jgi:hypothetical protein